MQRVRFWILLGCLLVGSGWLGVRWSQAAALAERVRQALLEQGVPVESVSLDLAGRLAITYRHGSDGHAGPNAPFYSDQIDSTLRAMARGTDSYGLTILDKAGGVVLAAKQPLSLAGDAGPARQNLEEVRRAFGQADPGMDASFAEGKAGIEAEVRLALAAHDQQAALDRAVQGLVELAEAQQANGLTRLALTVEDGAGKPVFTMVADTRHRVWRAWTAPFLRNPLAGGPPGPQKR